MGKHVIRYDRGSTATIDIELLESKVDYCSTFQARTSNGYIGDALFHPFTEE